MSSYLGIDTSNYTTSFAVCGDEDYSVRRILSVPEGARGVRQSDGVFLHLKNAPALFEELCKNVDISKISAVGVSTRPRSVEGSYMPVFTAGAGCARTVAAALGVPLYEFSHQEGHIEAVKHYSDLSCEDRLICFHFSGGTTEAVLVDKHKNLFEIVGGSKDLAYGQVLDRLGVTLGLDFPCGEALDDIALSALNDNFRPDKSLLTKIKVNNGFVNLSGIETQCQRIAGTVSDEELINALFYRISDSVADMTRLLSKKYNIKNFLYAGGVSCSTYMRNYLDSELGSHIKIVFGMPELSSDNAVGTALLGGKKIWL